MKLLVIISSLHYGGAERVVSLLTQEWAKSHKILLAVFDASAVVYPYGGQLVDLKRAKKTTIIARIYNALGRVYDIAKLIRDEKPDHIFTFMEGANFPAILAATTQNYLHRLSVSVRNSTKHFKLFEKILISLLYRLANNIVAVSSGVKQDLTDIPLPKQKIHVIYNPVFQPSAQDSHPLIPDNFILAVGRLVPQKGFDRLIPAFAQLESSNLELVILGEGGLREALSEQIKQLGVEHRVHLLGTFAEPAIWYQRAKCFVLSSRYEGFSNAMIEAMSCGCPVVSFDCHHGPAEIIEDGISGLLVKEGDIDALAKSINKLLSNHQLATDLATQAKKRAQDLSLDQIARQWIDMIAEN